MKGATAAAAASAALITTTVQAAQDVPGVVSWNIQRRDVHNSLQRRRRLEARAGTIEEDIANDIAKGGYFAICEIGTPGQQVTLQLDTGSSDIWVPAMSSLVCRDGAAGGCALGSFDKSESSSFDDFGSGDFSISYVDESHAEGDYFRDVFQIGETSITNMTMGLGLDTDIPYGLVGVGYAINEAIVSSTQSTSLVYPNLPQVMRDEGLINSVAFSLWLNDLDSNKGRILFGGIDTGKYTGNLTAIDIQPSQGELFSAFMVQMTSLQAVSPSGKDILSSSQLPIDVVLDSGTTLSYLPTDMVDQIWEEVGAIYSPSLGVAGLPCDMQTSKGYFTFGFAGPEGPKINVTMDELVLNLGPSAPVFTSGLYKGRTVCEFGILNSSSEPFLLGDTFLRSAYVVYDLVNNEIAMAPTNFHSKTSEVVSFDNMGAVIPLATRAGDQERVTKPPNPTVLAAAPGFTDSAVHQGGLRGAENSGTGIGEHRWAPAAVLGWAVGVIVLGSGLFVWL